MQSGDLFLVFHEDEKHLFAILFRDDVNFTSTKVSLGETPESFDRADFRCPNGQDPKTFSETYLSNPWISRVRFIPGGEGLGEVFTR